MRCQSQYHEPPIRDQNGHRSLKSNKQNFYGPRQPLPSNRALITVTKAGTLRTIYQDKDSRFAEIRTDLESPTGPSGTLSHASLCVEKAGGTGIVRREESLSEIANSI